MAALVALDKNLCNLPKHLAIDADGKVSSAPTRPSDALWIGVDTDVADDRCVRTLFRLEHTDLSVEIDERYTHAYGTLIKASNFPAADAWSIVSLSARAAWASDLLRTVQRQVSKLDSGYHVNVFCPTSKLFGLLRPWRAHDIDSAAVVNDPVARTCVPDENGMLSVPQYDRFGTRTGRLTVTNGPRVLTVRQTTRELFRPIDDDHLLVSLDFSSLEARIALALAQNYLDVDDDPYMRIAEMIRAESRDDAKTATFSALYSDPTSTNRSHDLNVVSVRRLFKLGETFAKLKQERDGLGGKVRNLYGRLLDVEHDETLYNNYVQSTGADVVMLGFSSIVSRLTELAVVPHFLLHDALFASVPRSKFEEVASLALAGVDVPKFLCKFPMKATIVGERPKF